MILSTNSTNVDLSNTSTLEHETSGMFVKTGDAKSSNLEIESVYVEVHAHNGTKQSAYRTWVAGVGSGDSALWDSSGLSKDQSSKNIYSGNVTLSDVILRSQGVVAYVQSGCAISGTARHGTFRTDHWNDDERATVRKKLPLIPASATTGDVFETTVKKTSEFKGKIQIVTNPNSRGGDPIDHQHIRQSNAAIWPAKVLEFEWTTESNIVGSSSDYLIRGTKHPISVM